MYHEKNDVILNNMELNYCVKQ